MINKLKKDLLEKNFFMPQWYSIFLNPYFTIRKPLFDNIKAFAITIDSNKKILDVGCGIKPYQSLFDGEYIGIDIEGGGHENEAKIVDKFFDGKKIPYEEDTFDVIICTEVLEHSDDPDKLMSECNRVLKKGGQIYLSMPFIYQEHETPYDFRRFTQYGHKKIFATNGFVIKKIIATTGVFRVCGQLLSTFIFENTPKGTLLKMILSFFILAPLQILFLLLDKIFKNNWATLNYIIIATKK